MLGKFQKQIQDELANIKEAGLYKKERIITNPQGASIRVSTGEEVLNFCANNYLGLSSHPDVIQAAKDALDTHGFGMSSVRFICGTQDIHKNLEKKISEFFDPPPTKKKNRILQCKIVGHGKEGVKKSSDVIYGRSLT